jgi:hypothetical protein
VLSWRRREPGPLSQLLGRNREELEIWTSNQVARGPLAIDGAGVEALIRIQPASADWCCAGPI